MNVLWSEDGIYILRNKYEKALPSELRVLLPGRTWIGIKKKTKKLGLKRKLRFFESKIEGLRGELSNDFKVELAWVAGFLDGEGTVCIHKQRGRKSPSYSVWVHASNTNPGALYRLQAIFGGTVCLPSRSKRSCNIKPLYRWAIAAQEAIRCIEAILPYVCLKTEQAHLALELNRIVQGSRLFHAISQQPLSQSEIAAREFLYLKVRVLNQRGRTTRGVQLNLGVKEQRDA